MCPHQPLTVVARLTNFSRSERLISREELCIGVDHHVVARLDVRLDFHWISPPFFLRFLMLWSFWRSLRCYSNMRPWTKRECFCWIFPDVSFDFDLRMDNNTKAWTKREFRRSFSMTGIPRMTRNCVRWLLTSPLKSCILIPARVQSSRTSRNPLPIKDKVFDRDSCQDRFN